MAEKVKIIYAANSAEKLEERINDFFKTLRSSDTVKERIIKIQKSKFNGGDWVEYFCFIFYE